MRSALAGLVALGLTSTTAHAEGWKAFTRAELDAVSPALAQAVEPNTTFEGDIDLQDTGFIRDTGGLAFAALASGGPGLVSLSIDSGQVIATDALGATGMLPLRLEVVSALAAYVDSDVTPLVSIERACGPLHRELADERLRGCASFKYNPAIVDHPGASDLIALDDTLGRYIDSSANVTDAGQDVQMRILGGQVQFDATPTVHCWQSVWNGYETTAMARMCEPLPEAFVGELADVMGTTALLRRMKHELGVVGWQVVREELDRTLESVDNPLVAVL